MAYSEKHVGITLVPWYKSSEWKYVCNLLYGDQNSDDTRKKALHILHIWKERVSLLCSGVEGTMIILEAMFTDEQTYSEKQVQLLYASTIMRFINVCINVKDHRCTVQELANKFGLPSWLVKIRHELAHDQKLPSVFICKKGLVFALNWLKHNYWLKEYDNIQDYSINVVDKGNKQQLFNLVQLYCEVTYLYITENIRTIGDIGDTVCQRIATLYKGALGKGWKQCNIFKMQSTMKKFLTKYVEPDSLSEITEFVCSEYLIKLPYLNDSGVIPGCIFKAWEQMLKLLFINNQGMVILEQMWQIVANKGLLHTKRLLGALWLQGIFNTLLKEKNPDTEKVNAEMRFYCYDDKCEQELRGLLQDMLKKPNRYTNIYIASLLNLCDVSDNKITCVKEIVNTYLHGDPLYVQKNSEMDYESLSEDDDDSITPNQNHQDPGNQYSRWTIFKDKLYFKNIPFGALPNKPAELNPVLHTVV